MQMNKQLQTRRIAHALKCRGIEPDLVDIEANIDSTLTLTENYNIIMASHQPMMHRVITQPTSSATKIGNMIQAREHFENLPQHVQRQDGKKKARTVLEMSDLTNKNYKRWKKNRNRMDIFGIDY